MLVEVAVSRKMKDYCDLLTYRVPQSLAPQVQWGSLVLVPIGRSNQQAHGYVTAMAEDDGQADYKDILAVPEPQTLLNRELVELAVLAEQILYMSLLLCIGIYAA